jgi:hypothetical protein
VKPECLDWQVLTERTADTEIPPLELVSQSHPPDNGLDVGCDGMVYSIFKKESVAMARNPPQRKHTVPDDPRAISLGTGAAPCNMHHQPEDLFSHWSCLGGSDIPELDDDEDYSLAESEVDDEETLAVEEQLPRDVCSGEELMLLTILGNSPLEEVCRIMNVPTVNTVLNSSDETENEVDAAIVTDLDVASDEVEVDEALPEPSPPISRLTVRFGGTVLEASMQGGRFKEVRERSYAFINRSYTDDRVITAPLPQLPMRQHGPGPPTTIAGSTKIDGLFVSHHLRGMRCGYTGYISDHFGLYIDLPMHVALGHAVLPILKPTMRRLKLEDPRVVAQFTKSYTDALENKIVAKRLQTIWNKAVTWYDATSADNPLSTSSI